MPCKPYRRLFWFFIFIVAVFTANAQDAKTALLKNVDTIPMPQPPQGGSFFIPINNTPQVIAMMQPEFQEGQKFRVSAIALSALGKGKLLLLGCPAYFKAPMLDNKDVVQLLENILNWAKPGGNIVHVAVTQNVETDFKDFLLRQNANVYTVKNFTFKKNTDLLILNRDVTDPVQLKQIENFIRAGGTMLFASPYSDLYNRKDTIADLSSFDLGINKLLAKAGLVNPNVLVMQSPDNKVLVTDSVPDYLRINTLLPRLLPQSKMPSNPGIDFLLNLSLDMIFKYNESNSPVISHIRQFLNVPPVLPVPSPAKPLPNNTPALKAGNKMSYWLYTKQQDFDHHPEAKAVGYNIFPGEVPANSPRVNETVIIPVKVGTQGLYDKPTVYYRPHSTGLYVPAGQMVKITIGAGDLQRHLKAQIGVHSDNLLNLEELKRIPADLTKTFELDKTSTAVYSPYGGLLLINIADTTTLKTIKISVNGAVKAPYFKLGETNEQDWNAAIRNNPAPWAELATDNIVLTVPSYRIRNLNNPVKLMQFWDEVMDADADLADISKKRVHQERIIVDADVAYGYMFTTPEKIVVPDDKSCEWMLNEIFIRKHGSWGHFHELGHRHQFWELDYPGTGEVTVNLFTMYVYDKVLHKGLYNHENLPDKAAVISKIKNYLANDPSYEKWCNDPFLALSMYIQIIDKFGWNAIKDANIIYRNLPKDKYPKTDQDKRDLWFTTICKTTNSDLSRFFDTWKIPVSDTAKKQVSSHRTWFPEELEAN
ncbi:M60 family metallopeptidase [Mucilaginibacter pocheonensis]|uniref:Peptidase M60 domain-containing protein n=1 Tax=Mucilaginibacter pocheonensis TaxID=398050 RepID=A0ABU1TDA4_9SPHI|nr:M60 family metallopeptidase [Mucilaginibacter pocheonensis]MDR6942825.1 hypothetical protein [Mucilaginibacter pocheonensis]